MFVQGKFITQIYQYFWITFSDYNGISNLLLTFTGNAGYIVTQTDITTLKNHIHTLFGMNDVFWRVPDYDVHIDVSVESYDPGHNYHALNLFERR